MKTTVVIPNYNGIEYLKACLDSLRKCIPQDFKIIVVDNGSTDGSPEYVTAKYPEIQLIPLSENTGFAAAVNRGIEAANTEYVILLNNDTVADEHFVKALETALDNDEKIFSASAKMIDMHNPDVIDGAGDYYCALGWGFAYGKGKDRDSNCNCRRNIFSACAGAAIYRRDILKDIGMFDEAHFAYLEDVDVGYRGRINGYRNIFEPEAVVLHAGSGSSGSRYNEFKINLSSRNSVYLIWKNMPLLQWVINLPFLITGFGIKTLFFILKGYGGVYIKGLCKGIALSFSRTGFERKVRFKFSNLGNYIRIQLELWLNIVRRFG